MPRGIVKVVGIGPGDPGFVTPQAEAALRGSDLIIGYSLYIEQVTPLLVGQEVVASSMGREVERCRRAVAAAAAGRRVALVSGGDPGIYGMAGLALQVAAEHEPPPPVEIIPGVTAAGAAAAALGAPLMHDFAAISLSDLLTPWDLIEKRLLAAASADFVIVLYNPRSKGRSGLLARALEIIREHRTPATMVGMVRAAGRKEERVWLSELAAADELVEEADMATLVIIGSSCSYRVGDKMITPRGYEL